MFSTDEQQVQINTSSPINFVYGWYFFMWQNNNPIFQSCTIVTMPGFAYRQRFILLLFIRCGFLLTGFLWPGVKSWVSSEWRAASGSFDTRSTSRCQKRFHGDRKCARVQHLKETVSNAENVLVVNSKSCFILQRGCDTANMTTGQLRIVSKAFYRTILLCF